MCTSAQGTGADSNPAMERPTRSTSPGTGTLATPDRACIGADAASLSAPLRARSPSRSVLFAGVADGMFDEAVAWPMRCDPRRGFRVLRKKDLRSAEARQQPGRP